MFVLGAMASSAFAFAPTVTVSSFRQHQKASALASSSESVDVSIPYDATVRLAYEASDKSISYDEFKPKYLEQAVAEVIAKQQSDTNNSDEKQIANKDTKQQQKQYDFALLFDCDGVILETEELHRLAYNAAFREFKVTTVCGDAREPVEWSVGYYDILQNNIGGGIPKMRHYFSQLLRFESNEHGDPTTVVANTVPSATATTASSASDADKGFAPPPQTTKKKKKNSKKKKKTSSNNKSSTSVSIAADDIATGLESLIASIQTRKTELYKSTVEESATTRPGLLNLMDEALADDSIAVGVCSASTKEAAQKVLECTLGKDRVSKLDVCILGDDVSEKKPSPMIYNAARDKLGIQLPTRCVVVEDSAVGLRAAKAANMRCLVTYTESTTGEDFYGMGADAKVPDLANSDRGPVTLDAIFAPLREAFSADSDSKEDQFPELLVGLKDEAVVLDEEEEEQYDEEDNLIWNTSSDENDDEVVEMIVSEDEASGRILKPKLSQDDMGNFSM